MIELSSQIFHLLEKSRMKRLSSEITWANVTQLKLLCWKMHFADGQGWLTLLGLFALFYMPLLGFKGLPNKSYCPFCGLPISFQQVPGLRVCRKMWTGLLSQQWSTRNNPFQNSLTMRVVIASLSPGCASGFTGVPREVRESECNLTWAVSWENMPQRPVVVMPKEGFEDRAMPILVWVWHWLKNCTTIVIIFCCWCCTKIRIGGYPAANPSFCMTKRQRS